MASVATTSVPLAAALPTLTPGALPGARGCGASRVAGGIYLEYGVPAEYLYLTPYLIDAPLPLDDALDLEARGVKLIQRGATWHILDWVGAIYYPNLEDFLEECQRKGLSRRLPITLDFSKLTPASRILLVHPRARVENADAYGPFPCPRLLAGPTPRPLHAPGTRACAGVWREDVEGGDPLADVGDPRAVVRRTPSVTYRARRRPDDVTPIYRPGFFLSLPISRIAVVGDRAGKATAAASRAHVPVASVAE